MKHSILSLTAAFAFSAVFGGLFSLPAAASPTGADAWVQLNRDGNQFYLFDTGSVKRMSFERPRDFRVCAKTRQDGVAIEVMHDDTSSVVAPGACMNFQAKSVAIRAQDEPGADWSLVGTVSEKMEARS